MQNQSRRASVGGTMFGQREASSKACVADRRQHIRSLFGDALEELGFIACECAAPAELGAVLDAHLPDVVLLGLACGAIEANAMLETLAGRRFSGMILPLGSADSAVALSVGDFGRKLGLAMLPAFPAAFANDNLRSSIAAVLPRGWLNAAVDLGEALRADWLELWYQPQVDARTLALKGAEALARMHHPRCGVLPPARFVPREDDPQFHAFSKFVVDRALADWRYFLAEHKRLDISVNLPLSFLRDPSALAYLCDRLPHHPAFDGLIVEIDAAEVVRNLPLVRDLARDLRFHRIAIAIDDLGTEWSALAGFVDFPFAMIKADRSFVCGCADDRAKEKVCRHIVELAGAYGARTVAEGIETRADFLAARDIGFDMIQGFLFGKPMATKKFARKMLCAS